MRKQRFTAESHAGWVVEYHPDYLLELKAESEAVQDGVFTVAAVLKGTGPLLGRPYADTLNGSAYPHMKELRFTLPDGEWRVAFAFDPRRQAILLCGGSKSGVGQKRFCERLIRMADRRYADHLLKLKVKED
jgi:hypothetical protein